MTREQSLRRRQYKRLALGLAFLGPNILGFLGFTLFPLIVSLVMAFTNWDLRLHNMFKPGASPQFVGLDNFRRLFAEPQLWQYFGNTLYFMAGTPFCIAGSLMLAMLLSKDLGAGGRRGWGMLLAGAGLMAGTVMLVLVGMHVTAIILLVAGLGLGILIGGTGGGSTVYRTLFYVPNFTAGVAIFLLWKKLYNPTAGPVNAMLAPLLEVVQHVVQRLPAPLVTSGGWVGTLLTALLMVWGLWQLTRNWRDGEMGSLALILSELFVLLPLVTAWWLGWLSVSAPLVLGLIVVSVVIQVAWVVRGRTLTCRAAEALGTGLMLSCTLLTFQFMLVGLALVCVRLPAMAQDGLTPPEWLTDYNWAKPAIMLMGFWASLGSSTMLLYLAGLSNVPGELYEAADIDGASRFQKFWHITWPQLAPTTFFIVVMSVIGGLQGGFDTAKTMTNGGPAGSTTTLSYFIYTEGFQTGRLGYSSAVAWTLFLLVLVVTLFNWRFGNRYVND